VGRDAGAAALVVTLLQVGSFVTKVVVMIFFLMLIRWTLRASGTIRPCAWAGWHSSRSRSPIVLRDWCCLTSRHEPRSRFYLREVFSGLGLTAGHFFRNMAAHRALARRRDARGAVTIQYRTSGAGWRPRRSLHRLVRREDGSPPAWRA